MHIIITTNETFRNVILKRLFNNNNKLISG